MLTSTTINRLGITATLLLLTTLAMSSAGGCGGSASGTDPRKVIEDGQFVVNPETGITEPVLLPQKIVISPPDSTDGQILVIGQSGAADYLLTGIRAKTQVVSSQATGARWIYSATSQETQRVSVQSDGAFSLLIQSAPGEWKIELVLEDSQGSLTSPLLFDIPRMPVLPLEENWYVDEINNGELVVAGSGVTAPSTRILLANDDTGEIGSAFVDEGGAFSLVVGGSDLDLLLGIAIGPAGVSHVIRGAVSRACSGNFCTPSEVCGHLPPELTVCEAKDSGPPWCRNPSAEKAGPMPNSDGKTENALQSDDEHDCPKEKCKSEKLCGKNDHEE